MDNYIISFSLFGNDYKYNKGALENIEISPKIYPGWACYIYYSKDADYNIIKKLSKVKYVKLFKMDNSKITPKLWRYIPVFETKSTVIVRDTDSRLNVRESSAVMEWLSSSKDVHIMRDHEAHVNKIMAGMFGARNGVLTHYKEIFYIKSNVLNISNPLTDDESILSQVFYPKIIDKAFIHDSNFNYEPFSKNFPETTHIGFVGEIINEKRPKSIYYRSFYLMKRIISFLYRYLKRNSFNIPDVK